MTLPTGYVQLYVVQIGQESKAIGGLVLYNTDASAGETSTIDKKDMNAGRENGRDESMLE